MREWPARSLPCRGRPPDAPQHRKVRRDQGAVHDNRAGPRQLLQAGPGSARPRNLDEAGAHARQVATHASRSARYPPRPGSATRRPPVPVPHRRTISVATWEASGRDLAQAVNATTSLSSRAWSGREGHQIAAAGPSGTDRRRHGRVLRGRHHRLRLPAMPPPAAHGIPGPPRNPRGRVRFDPVDRIAGAGRAEPPDRRGPVKEETSGRAISARSRIVDVDQILVLRASVFVARTGWTPGAAVGPCVGARH